MARWLVGRCVVGIQLTTVRRRTGQQGDGDVWRMMDALMGGEGWVGGVGRPRQAVSDWPSLRFVV